MYNNTLYSGESLLLWPSNNKPMQRITWTDGKIDGFFKSWYENGKQNQDIAYKNGIRHGSFKTYYENGSPEVICSYSNGKLDGSYTLHYKNGRTRKRATSRMVLKRVVLSFTIQMVNLNKRGNISMENLMVS